MEKRLIEWLKKEFAARTAGSYATIGIGDDCAVLPPNDTQLVVTCDAILDGVHFETSQHKLTQIGHKALAVNLSDLASMAATPRAAVVSLNLPRAMKFEEVTQLYEGMRSLAEKFSVEICGGDTNVWDGPLSISVTAIGTAPETGVWTIDGANPGDRIVVTGLLGGSLLYHHLHFEPHHKLVGMIQDKRIVKACTDISDSLSIDLAKVAKASGVGFEIEAEKIPVGYSTLKIAEHSDKSELEHALTDGEDFELIFAVSPDDMEQLMSQIKESYPNVTDIGCFAEGSEFWLVADGQKNTLEPQGYEHRFDADSTDLNDTNE